MYIPHNLPPPSQNPFENAFQSPNKRNEYNYPKVSQFPTLSYQDKQRYSGNDGFRSNAPPNNFDPYAYNFHKISKEQNNNGGFQNSYPTRNQFSHSLKQNPKPVNNRRIQEQNLDNNKSFLDKFDNNNSALLNQQKSHARNIRGRLFDYQQPSAERAKQEKMRLYRQELQKQMKNDHERKQLQKKKIDEEEMKRQQKFYQQFKIQAQKSNKNGQEENPYFMMRTHQRIKKKEEKQNISLDSKGTDDIGSRQNNPKIIRRAYHNRSSFDNPEGYNTRHKTQKEKITPLEQKYAEEREKQQERIAKILMFQENVLRKLSDIKHQIRATTNVLNTDSELQKIRASLKARNLKQFSNDLKKSNVVEKSNNHSQFYSLPRKNARPIFPSVGKDRLSLKMHDLQKKQTTTYESIKNNGNIINNIEEGESRVTTLEDKKPHKIFNDKNIIGEEPEQSLEDQ